MSYIDCFKHELVGYLNSLPIYHPLVEFNEAEDWPPGHPMASSPDMRSNDDFLAGPTNLVIGGGSGEHPGLVLHNLGVMALDYVIGALEAMVDIPRDQFEYYIDVNALLDKLYALRARDGNYPRLEFCMWDVASIVQFAENARSRVHHKPLEQGETVEEWIVNSIGEFVYRSLPELNNLREQIDAIVPQNILMHGYAHGNVVCPPPGYIRTRQDTIDAGKFQEVGHFRWEYVNPTRWERKAV